MEPAYIAAIFGLVGALIGSMASVVTMLIQSKIKDRRDRMQQVTSLAIEHYKVALEDTRKRGGGVLPPSAFASYYLQFVELMESGRLNAETLSALNKEQSKIEAIFDLQQKKGANKPSG